jgi:hypothetical protein
MFNGRFAAANGAGKSFTMTFLVPSGKRSRQFIYKICHFVHSLVPSPVLSLPPFPSKFGGKQPEKKQNPTADFPISTDVNL